MRLGQDNLRWWKLFCVTERSMNPFPLGKCAESFTTMIDLQNFHWHRTIFIDNWRVAQASYAWSKGNRTIYTTSMKVLKEFGGVPGNSGAAATTWGKSKFIPWMWGCAATILARVWPSQPPTSTRVFISLKPWYSLIASTIRTVVEAICELRLFLNSRSSSAYSQQFCSHKIREGAHD